LPTASRKRSREDQVEVVPGEVVEEELDLYRFLLAAAGERVEHHGDDGERVGP
jgi:hypothetical protein